MTFTLIGFKNKRYSCSVEERTLAIVGGGLVGVGLGYLIACVTRK
jgi:hypothetical protein